MSIEYKIKKTYNEKQAIIKDIFETYHSSNDKQNYVLVNQILDVCWQDITNPLISKTFLEIADDILTFKMEKVSLKSLTN